MPARGIPGSWRLFRIWACSPGDGHDGAGGRFVNGPTAEVGNQAAAPVQRDRFIPLRKSDIMVGLMAGAPLAATGREGLKHLPACSAPFFTTNISKSSIG